MVLCAHIAGRIFLVIIAFYLFADERWISLEVDIASTKPTISKNFWQKQLKT